MTRPDPTTGPPRHTERGANLVGPVVLWMLVQLAALALPVIGVPLSARFPKPPEQLALHEVLVVQVVLAGVLCPILLTSARSAAIIVLTSLPFIQLAAYLSAIPLAQAAWAAEYVAIWITGLALWTSVARRRGCAMPFAAIVNLLTLGPVILWYLRAEFSTQPATMNWTMWGTMCPTLGALAQVVAEGSSPWPWIALLVFGITGIGARRFLRRQPVGESGDRPAAPD